jgi:hypothetical protein
MQVSCGTNWELYEDQGFYYLRLHFNNKVQDRFIQVPIGTMRMNTAASIANIILRHTVRQKEGSA